MKNIVAFLCISLPLILHAQVKHENPTYPLDYFRNPLDIPILLAGNFGECRPGHFHSGIDIKTLGEENQPVHAAADGYISRIKMEKGGFGHAIYITHPNGFTTLYAHLNNFFPELQQIVKKQQYIQKHWDVDIKFTLDDFPVQKGQLIAWSGNTGASSAPHLHFEIRDSKSEHPLNPQLFGFPIIDYTQPKLFDLIFYSGNVYEDTTILVSLNYDINGEKIYKLNNASTCKTNIKNDTIELWTNTVGIGIRTDDYMDESDNTLAPYQLKLFMDDSLQCEITLDNIGYEETRYINAFADYKTKEIYNKWFLQFFKLQGNRLDKIYTFLNKNGGKLNFSDHRTHKICIEVKDDVGNISKTVFFAKPTLSYTPKTAVKEKTLIKSGETSKFSTPYLQFNLDDKQLYEDFYFKMEKNKNERDISDKYNLQPYYIPIHHYFDLGIKPNKPVPFALRDKIIMICNLNDNETGRATKFNEEGWYTASVRNLGEYWLELDTIPPVIKGLQKNENMTTAKQITFVARDEKTSIKKFNGYLDGNWICFEQHGNLFFYKFDEYCTKGKHHLVFTAEDENGNKKSITYNFNR